jgi:RNA polymerase sigma factor (sigma-70 family)
MTASEATIGRNLVRLFECGAVAGPTETQLLDHVGRRDGLTEAAFEAILTRHGPAVSACCRRVLGDSASAEDAFQATFLVLFCRAGSIRVQETVLPWLLHVARMAAIKTKEADGRRLVRERSVARPDANAPDEEDRDLQILVRAEVDCLPAKYRDPVRLCYFEGRTQDTAAAALGWPVGTVRGRLLRARDMLRKRLLRRGVGVTPVVAGAMLAASADARAEIPRTLREATMAITSRGAVTRAGILALAAAVGRALAVTASIKTAAVGLAVLALLGTTAAIAALVQRNENSTRKLEPLRGEPGVRAAAVDRYGDPLPKGAIARLGTVRFRSQSEGARSFLTPDGKTLVAASAGGQARVWDMATGRLVRSISAHEAVLSPDGKTLFAADPGVLRAVDFFDGRELRRTETSVRGNLDQLVGSPDGKSLGILVSQRFGAANGMPETRRVLTVYDPATFASRFEWEKKNGLVQDFAFSSDGRFLAVAGSAEGEREILTEPKASWVRLHDARTGAEVREIAIEGFGASSVAFAPDSKTVAVGVGDHTIRIFDVATGQERLPRLGREIALPPRKPGERLLKHYDKAWAAGCLAFSPNGKTLASGTEGIGWFNRPSDVPPIRLWDLASAREIQRFRGHPIGCISLAFAHDGKTLASSGFEPVARLWDVTTGREIDHRAGHASRIMGLAVSRADETVFSVSYADGPVLHWNPSDGRLIENLGVYSQVINNLQISPDGRTLLFLNENPKGESVLWDVASRKELRQLASDTTVWCYEAAFSPDGRLVTAGYRIWDVSTGRLLKSLATPGTSTWCLPAFSADGREVITVESNQVRIWDTATGAELRRPVDKIPMANNAAISPDGRLVAVGQQRFGLGPPTAPESPDNVPARLVDPIRVWEVASGKEVAALYGHTALSNGLAFSPDGRMLASVSGAWQSHGDPGVRVWDVASGVPLRRFKNESGGGFRVAFLPDGRSIVTSGDDGTALVWDVSDLAERRVQEPLDAKTFDALWSDLASDDAVRGYRASWALSAPGAVKFLREHLRTTAAGEPKIGPQVLRSLRAIAALERVGNQSAREILEGLARGDHGAPATKDAAAALLRLSRGHGQARVTGHWFPSP